MYSSAAAREQGNSGTRSTRADKTHRRRRAAVSQREHWKRKYLFEGGEQRSHAAGSEVQRWQREAICEHKDNVLRAK